MSSTNLTMRVAQANINYKDSARSATQVTAKNLVVKEKSALQSVPIAKGSVDSRTITDDFTFTVANLKNRLLTLTGALGAGKIGTTPTAAQLVASMNKGDSWPCLLINTTGQTITLAGGAGVTIASAVLTVSTATATELVITILNNAVGSESVCIALSS